MSVSAALAAVLGSCPPAIREILCMLELESRFLSSLACVAPSFSSCAPPGTRGAILQPLFRVVEPESVCFFLAVVPEVLDETSLTSREMEDVTTGALRVVVSPDDVRLERVRFTFDDLTPDNLLETIVELLWECAGPDGPADGGDEEEEEEEEEEEDEATHEAMDAGMEAVASEGSIRTLV